MTTLPRMPIMTNPKLVTKAYNEGKQAFERGDDSNCPYEPTVHTDRSEERKAWYDGYYIARIKHKVGHILTKYNLKYP